MLGQTPVQLSTLTRTVARVGQPPFQHRDPMAEAPGRLNAVEASRMAVSARSKKQRPKSGALRRTNSAMKEEQAPGHQRAANLR
jgi:hypothetical protein